MPKIVASYEVFLTTILTTFVDEQVTYCCYGTIVLQGQAYVPGQAIWILHPRLICIFKNFFYKVCSYIPKLQKMYKKIHHRFMVKNLEF